MAISYNKHRKSQMQITLANGNIVSGTVAELKAAGLLASNAATTTSVNKHRPGTQRHRIAEAILKAQSTGKPQHLATTIDGELNARTQIHRVASGLGIKTSTTKLNKGNRIALAISAINV